MNKKKILLVIPLVIVLSITLLIQNPSTTIRFAWATGSSPDAYGNRICSLNAEQHNGTDWNWFTTGYSYNGLVENFDSSVTNAVAYSYGQDWWRVKDNQPIQFRLCVYLNKTFATDGANAQSNVKAYLNITGGAYSLLNEEFVFGIGISQNATYWRVVGYYNWNVTSYPVVGITYNMVIRYEAYY